MKRPSIFLLLLFSLACSLTAPLQTTPTAVPVSQASVTPILAAPSPLSPLPLGEGEKSEGCLTFAVNVHDWTHPAESAAILLKLVDLFEKYGVRGDPLPPPWNLAAPDPSRLRSQSEQAAILAAYQELLAYAAANLRVVTSEDILELAK